jgi:SAM-dependent methyltransferase
MTTAGHLVPEPLAKEQCMACGLLARRASRYLGETDFYEKSYEFFERPGAGTFDRPRYNAMAAWIAEALNGWSPASILDAGCGRGWMMRALREQYPAATFKGVEPSEQESETARSEGWTVDTAKVDAAYPVKRRYDLVYCTNVVEHTTDPVEFLAVLRRLMAPGGRIVVTCPDASYASAEFMFSDQNFSFTPQQLQSIARAAGLLTVAWRPAPVVNSLRDKQLCVFDAETPAHDSGTNAFRNVTAEQLFAERADYVASYVRCDKYLHGAVGAAERVFNFGASTWSMLLRAYCPAYWQRVTACAIDGGHGIFQGRPLENFGALQIGSNDALVLGVNPYSQADFTRKLQDAGIAAPVSWAHVIPR